MEAVVSPALNFGGLLRQFRTEARLTQEELAEAAGISPRSVSELESAAAFSTRTLPKPPRTSGALEIYQGIGAPGARRVQDTLDDDRR